MRLVALPNGAATVPVPAVEFAVDLERRELRLVLDDDGTVLVAGALGRLTDDDHRNLAAWQTALAAIVTAARPAKYGGLPRGFESGAGGRGRAGRLIVTFSRRGSNNSDIWIF